MRRPWRLVLRSGVRVDLYNLDPHPEGDGATRQIVARLNAQAFRKRELAYRLDREYGPDKRGPGLNWGQWPI